MRITPEVSRKLKRTDPRVQAIRCKNCHRLRQHPVTDDPRTHYCGCGGVQFVASFPHDDEIHIALKLYARQIEERNLYGVVAREVIDEYRVNYGMRKDDLPKRKIILK